MSDAKAAVAGRALSGRWPRLPIQARTWSALRDVGCFSLPQQPFSRQASYLPSAIWNAAAASGRSGWRFENWLFRPSPVRTGPRHLDPRAPSPRPALFSARDRRRRRQAIRFHRLRAARTAVEAFHPAVRRRHRAPWRRACTYRPSRGSCRTVIAKCRNERWDVLRSIHRHGLRGSHRPQPRTCRRVAYSDQRRAIPIPRAAPPQTLHAPAVPAPA